MIVGAAAVPTSVLMVAGVGGAVPPEVQAVRVATTTALAGLPRADAALLFAHGPLTALHEPRDASLAGVGLPGVTRRVSLAEDAEHLAERISLRRSVEPAPIDLAVLGHLAPATALIPVAVADEDGETLCDLGTRLGAALDATATSVVVVGAGDLAAGLSTRAPLHLVDGAEQWEALAVAALESLPSSGPHALAALGPGEARRVGSRGWASLVVLAAMCARVGRPLAVHVHAAPRGVGYVVASG